MKEQFEKQGHRGCAGLMPENTIPAMLEALRLGVTNLELDVVITKDDQVVLSHDPFLNHLIATKPDGRGVTVEEEPLLAIRNFTYDQLCQYDVGIRPNPEYTSRKNIPTSIPLLADVINNVERCCVSNNIPLVTYNIEIKSTRSDDGIYYTSISQYAELVMSVVHAKQVEGRIVLISFDERVLQYIHQQYPSIKTGLISYDMNKFNEELKSLGYLPEYYSPAFATVSRSGIESAHLQGIRIVPWTVNSKEQIEHLITIGVDGIITDYPNLF